MLVTLIAGKRRRLLFAKDGRRNVYGEYEAATIKDCARGIVLLKLTRQTGGIARPLCGSRATCMYYYSLDAPRIICPTTSAAVGDKNVAIVCRVLCKPRASLIFWQIVADDTIDQTTRLCDGEHNLHYRATVSVGYLP